MDRILIADDDEICRIILEEKLRKDYIVDCVCDGDEAIESMLKHDYDCLLLDIMMPNVNGFEVIDFMNANSMMNLFLLL